MMESTGPDLPDNLPRYISAEKIIKRYFGTITLEHLKKALSNKKWFDQDNEVWNSKWSEDPDIQMFSPENKHPKYGCCMRRAFDLENKTIYLMMGSQDTIISKVPGSLGTYCKVELKEDPMMIAVASVEEGQRQIWLAAKYISQTGIMDERIQKYFDQARTAIYSAINHYNFANAAQNTKDRLSLVGKAISKANEAQCYAQAVLTI